MDFIEARLTPEQQAILEEIALALDYKLLTVPLAEDRLRADDDVLLYSKKFVHITSHEALWGVDREGELWCADLSGTYIVFYKLNAVRDILEKHGSFTRQEFDRRF